MNFVAKTIMATIKARGFAVATVGPATETTLNVVFVKGRASIAIAISDPEGDLLLTEIKAVLEKALDAQ